MTTTQHKDPRAVIEQLVEALKELDKDWREFNRTSYGLQGEATDDFYSLATTKAAITAGREALKLRTCTWTQHDDVHMPSTYETECGELWSFVEGGPSDNKTKFCHGCGGLVCEPIVGLQSVHDAITDDPSLCEPAPERPTNCGTGHCSCIECVMEPAPSTAGEDGRLLKQFLSAAKEAGITHWSTQPAQGDLLDQLYTTIIQWDEGVGKRSRRELARRIAALLQSTPDARPVGELTEPQWEEIAESCVHLNFEECYLDSVKSMGELILAAARTQAEN